MDETMIKEKIEVAKNWFDEQFRENAKRQGSWLKTELITLG